MGSRPGSPFGLENKCLIFGGFTDSPHPHKQETRGFDTAIQATSFLGGYGRFDKKPEIRKSPQKSQVCTLIVTLIKQEKLVFILVILYIREYFYVFNKKLWVHGYTKVSNFGYLVPEITTNAQPYKLLLF